jgi:ankyrin repeat protein
MNYLESKGINTSIFKNLPKTNQEIEEDEKLGKENQDLNWFVSLPPQEKYNYIGRGHWLTNEQFDYLWNNKFYSLLEQYVKTGLQLNDYQIDKIITNKDLKNNYLHNRIIADQHDGMNKKEYELLNQKQKDKLFENLSDKQKLIKAIAIGHLELVKNLVEKDVSIENAVEIAAVNGNLDVVKYLVETGYEIGNTVESAAANGYLDIVMYLVGEKGARIGNAVKNAAENGSLDIVKYLVEKGASIGNAVAHAARRGHLDVVKYLVETGYEIGKAVEYAARNGHLDVVKYLVEKGASIGDAVEDAAENGHLDIVKYLVGEKGASIGSASFNAAKQGHTDIVRYLRTIQARN